MGIIWRMHFSLGMEDGQNKGLLAMKVKIEKVDLPNRPTLPECILVAAVSALC